MGRNRAPHRHLRSQPVTRVAACSGPVDRAGGRPRDGVTLWHAWSLQRGALVRCLSAGRERYRHRCVCRTRRGRVRDCWSLRPLLTGTVGPDFSRSAPLSSQGWLLDVLAREWMLGVAIGAALPPWILWLLFRPRKRVTAREIAGAPPVPPHRFRSACPPTRHSPSPPCGPSSCSPGLGLSWREIFSAPASRCS